GFNDRANHAMLLQELETTIPEAARHGVPNVIAMFGNRRGKSDAEGIDNCVAGLNQIKALAEAQGVTVCLELLNSKVDHKDYQGDHTAFGVAVMKAVNSPRVKLLYDIYHMQIMEGDVIRTIREHANHIGHFHTGGVPGRHEIDGTQELNYHAVAAAIADTGFTGYLAHEFVPTRDPLTSLHQLNYGIFLLAGVGAYLLFSSGPAVPGAAVVYGIGLGLTFDEFGMWLHLNGDYWQRASFDAIVVLAAGLGLAGFAPPIRR